MKKPKKQHRKPAHKAPDRTSIPPSIAVAGPVVTGPAQPQTPPAQPAIPATKRDIPPLATALFQRALGAHNARRLDEAEALYREALGHAPWHPHALNNLGILLKSLARFAEAEACYRQAIAVSSDEAHVYSNFGCLFAEQHRDSQAIAVLKRALALRPDYPDALFNLGNCLRNVSDRKGAMAAYLRALLVRPDMAEAHANKGDLHREAADLAAAVDEFVAAIKLNPGLSPPYNNLGEALKEQGRLDEAVSVFREGLEKHPKEALMHSNLLLILNYMPAVPPDLVGRVHAFWGQQHAEPLRPGTRVFAQSRDPDRRLRVGYVSPDFCTHSCSFFSEPLIREHDRNAVELFLYPTSRRQDPATARFKALADHWRPLAGVSDDAATALILEDRIDILVDLAGHTCDTRLLVFARTPAPVQVSWLGYPNTTGMAAMNYRLTDAVADPPGAHDAWYTETLERLPTGFLTFRPVIAAPVQERPPSATAGHITFGSFNNTSKVTPEVVRVWAAIMRQVDGSRMIVKSKQLGDAPTRQRYIRLFAEAGIEAGRIDLLPRLEPVENHLRAYDRVDIALDPFPYNGTTTTCEALWMGVPVVTWAGVGHVARVGASILTHCGLSELVADSEAGYIATAVGLARDPPRLAHLRGTMRQRLEGAPLSDHKAFARAVESSYRRMWRDWLAGKGR
jgi:predicted O-linked N-acetylglucosamine transferase (SPINDLY family)